MFQLVGVRMGLEFSISNDIISVILICLPSEYLLWLLVQADDLGMSATDYVFIYCRFGPVAYKDLIPSHALIDTGE